MVVSPAATSAVIVAPGGFAPFASEGPWAFEYAMMFEPIRTYPPPLSICPASRRGYRSADVSAAGMLIGQVVRLPSTRSRGRGGERAERWLNDSRVSRGVGIDNGTEGAPMPV